MVNCEQTMVKSINIPVSNHLSSIQSRFPRMTAMQRQTLFSFSFPFFGFVIVIVIAMIRSNNPNDLVVRLAYDFCSMNCVQSTNFCFCFLFGSSLKLFRLVFMICCCYYCCCCCCYDTFLSSKCTCAHQHFGIIFYSINNEQFSMETRTNHSH